MSELADMLITVVDERRHVHSQQAARLVRQANDSDYPIGRSEMFRRADYHKAVEDELKLLVVKMREIVDTEVRA